LKSATNKAGLSFKFWERGDVNLTFRRNFGEEEELEWEALLDLMEGTISSHDTDTVAWGLEKSGEFTTSSLYREILFPGVSTKHMLDLWGASLPLKIKIFLWQVYNDKIKSAEQLKLRNWQGPIECKMCGQLESTYHIVFGCAMPRFVLVEKSLVGPLFHLASRAFKKTS
jgi:hypothetical protein